MANEFPTTVDAAVRLLLGMVEESEQTKIAAMDSADIYTLHFGLGMWIRNHMGFYAGNDQLLKANGRVIVQHLSSTSTIGRDRRDTRHIYQVAYDDYGLDDLTGYALSQVKLVFRMAKQPHRKAHNVPVQITSPNGLNDKSKTEADRKRVNDQLARLGVLCEF